MTRASALVRLAVPDAVGAAERALDQARRHDDPKLLARALVAKVSTELLAPVAASESALAETVQLLTTLGDEAEIARVTLQLSKVDVSDSLQPHVAAAENAYRVAVRTGNARLAATAALELAMYLPATDTAAAERWRATAEVSLRPDDLVGPAKLAYARALTDSVALEHLRLLESAHRLRQAASAAGLPQFENFADLYELEALTETGQLTAAEAILGRLQDSARRRPFLNVRMDALNGEVALRARQGRIAEAEVALGQMAALAPVGGAYWESCVHEARGCALLDRGQFAAAAAELEQAHALVGPLDQEALGLKLSLRRLVAALCAGVHVSIAAVQELRSTARRVDAPVVTALVARWLELDEALRSPHQHVLDLPEARDIPEVKALDLELGVLRGGDPDALLAARDAWASLGTTVWAARSLLWHGVLTGTPHPEADELLAVLEAPAGLADTFRAQVSGLRG